MLDSIKQPLFARGLFGRPSTTRGLERTMFSLQSIPHIFGQGYKLGFDKGPEENDQNV